MNMEQFIQKLFRDYRKQVGKGPDDERSYTYDGVTYAHFKAGYMFGIGYGAHADEIVVEMTEEDLLK